MTVQNLPPDSYKNVLPGEIQSVVHVYRPGSGSRGPGTVGWQPTGGQHQIVPLAAGETVTFQVNGSDGLIVNLCPSKVQLLWNNAYSGNDKGIVQGGAHEIGQKLALASAPKDSATQAMSALNKQWYNALVSACHLDPNTFQLVQTNQSLASTSEELWNIADAVPPLSITQLFNPSQANVFSTDYGAVIANLKPQNDTTFQQVMQDYYARWMAYLNTNPALPAKGGILDLFRNWSEMHMPPGQAQAAYTAYQSVSQGTVPVAMQLWMQAGGGTGGLKAYNATIAQLTDQLNSASGRAFSFNTDSASSDITHTWAQVEAAGIFDIFEGGGESNYNELTTHIATSDLQASVTFERLLQFPLAPLSRPSSDPILSGYQPWFSSAALNLAFQHQDNTVWKNIPPNWDDTFGLKGNMQRAVSALVIVDGITISIRSNATFSESEQKEITAAAEGGFWPFFAAAGNGGWTHDTSFDSNGGLTVNSSSLKGNPGILGVIVTPMDQWLQEASGSQT